MENYLELEMIQQDAAAVVIQLMDDYGDQTVRLVYQYVKNRQVAEDLTQEIFVKCFEKIHTFKGESSLKTWLYRIAVNHAKDYERSWYARNISVDEFAIYAQQSLQSLEAQVLAEERKRELMYAINQLPNKYKDVIYLAYFHGLTGRDIADALKVSENTVKTRLRKAKALLKKRLGDDKYDEY